MSQGSGRAATRNEDRIGIFASVAEAGVVEQILRQSRGQFECMQQEELACHLRSGAIAGAILSGEVLAGMDLAAVEQAIEAQPPWSAFPFVLLLDRQQMESLGPQIDLLGHVVIVERPIHPAVLLNAAQAAIRSRARQREAEAYLLQRESAEEHLQQLTLTLQNRVQERMRELKAANDRLVEEVRERQATEERLRESEELYRHTLELSRQMVWTADASGKFLYFSPQFSEATGGDMTTPPASIIHPEDVEEVLSAWQHAVEEGLDHVAEFRMRTSDGSFRSFRSRAAPRRDGQGNIVRWYGTTEDIHDQKEAEQARLEAEERYRLAALATNDAVWDLDLREEMIRWADAGVPVFGYRVATEDTPLSWWEENLHPDDRERVSTSFQAAIDGPRDRWSAGYRFRRADGSYADVLDRGFIIRDVRGRAIRAVGAMMDVTERRRADAELRRMQSELIHVSRVSAMGTMGSTLAHELNQPLTAAGNYIRGCRRLLEQVEAPEIPQVQDALQAAETGVLRAGQIVRRLRELVSRGSVSTSPEKLPEVIEEANLIAFVDEQLLGVSHRLQLDPAAIWVRVDRIQIQQVIINLIRNAVQAMQNQPIREVSISTRAIDGQQIEVSVADTGSGISEEVREAMFSPFQTTKADGMGIGLSISRTIIEAHGGKIWAEDRPGGGSIFRFTVPRVEAPDADKLGLAEPLPS